MKGRPRIQDEFTHRTDLTARQRWELRNGRTPGENPLIGHKCRGEGSLLEKSRRVDLGLSLLSCIALPGERFTYKDIAAWCDCSWQAIFRIEQKALRKLRVRLGAEQLEAIEILFSRDRRPALPS